MFKFIYAIYGAIVLIASTVTNLYYAGESGTTPSNWSRQSGGSGYAGGSGSSGGYSSGGHHK